MRIISGIYKGRQIKAPGHIRPTQDMARKALFDILGDMQDMSFLDLFAGSGAVGLEALSMGAKEVVFVEKDNQCIKALQQNVLGVCKGEGLASPCAPSVMHKDVFQALPEFFKKGRKFDVVFLDPPYYQEMAKKTLQILGAYDILTHYGFIVAQHFKKDILPEQADNFSITRQSGYGDTLLSFYART